MPGVPAGHPLQLLRAPPLARQLGEIEPVHIGDRGGEDAVGHGALTTCRQEAAARPRTRGGRGCGRHGARLAGAAGGASGVCEEGAEEIG